MCAWAIPPTLSPTGTDLCAPARPVGPTASGVHFPAFQPWLPDLSWLQLLQAMRGCSPKHANCPHALQARATTMVPVIKLPARMHAAASTHMHPAALARPTSATRKAAVEGKDGQQGLVSDSGQEDGMLSGGLRQLCLHRLCHAPSSISPAGLPLVITQVRQCRITGLRQPWTGLRSERQRPVPLLRCRWECSDPFKQTGCAL